MITFYNLQETQNLHGLGVHELTEFRENLNKTK